MTTVADITARDGVSDLLEIHSLIREMTVYATAGVEQRAAR